MPNLDMGTYHLCSRPNHPLEHKPLPSYKATYTHPSILQITLYPQSVHETTSPAPPPDGTLEPQHPAHHLGFTVPPAIVTDTPPGPIIVDLHGTFVDSCQVAASDQPDRVGKRALWRS